VVYARSVNGQELSFAASGMLWRDSLVMMDRQTKTLWSHVTGEALRGHFEGRRLERIPAVQTTWERWRAAHPDTLVLAKERPTRGSVYDEYRADPKRFGILRARRAVGKLPGKTLIHGTVVGGSAVAIADRLLEEQTEREAQVSGGKVVFRRSPDGGTRAYEVGSGNELPVTRAFWFAWIAFYPETELIE
jgi:hypothetical protein